MPVQDLEKSDESWRQKVEDLKKSNPLVTNARRMLNKVTEATLKTFTQQLVSVLQEAEDEGRDVMQAAVESFMSFLFKKSSIDKLHRSLYADLLSAIGECFWQNERDNLCQLLQECIQVECDKMFQCVVPENKFKLRGSSEWLAILFSRNIVDENRFFQILRPVIFSIDDDDIAADVRNLSLDIATNSLLHNMKEMSKKKNIKKGKKNIKNQFRQRFEEYILFLEEQKMSFKPRERFSIQDVCEEYYGFIQTEV